MTRPILRSIADVAAKNEQIKVAVNAVNDRM